MEDVRQAVGRASFRSYVSNPFKSKKAKVKRPKEAPNTLNVSYLQKAPSQWASNQHWYRDDLSRVKDSKVRLLYLEPGHSQDPIAGRLVCHSVKQKPRYDALSYSWGEQDDWTQITLDGRPGFAVTRTLWSALRRLRSTAVARPIWIDAICINQTNTAERNQQVDMMDTTFGNARSVLIWLGDCGDSELGDRNPYLVDTILSKLERDTTDLKSAWWNRLWVVQEVALAKELMVYFGPHVVTWANFFGSAESRPNFKGVVNLRTARAFVQSHGFARKDEVSLEELLALTGNCYASDPLDYVFGIIGLVPGQQHLRKHNLYPDYTLTPYELLKRLNNYLESVGSDFAGTTMLNKMLSWTASVGHLQLAKLILNSGQIDSTTAGPLALSYAARRGQVRMLKMLLDDFHLDPNSRDHKGRTTLFSAAVATESKAVRLLIHEYHVDPSVRDNLGGTPLSYAVANRLPTVIGIDNILDTVRIILDTNEVDPDSEDAKGRTPLGWAVHAGSEPVVRLLLDTGRIDLSRCFDGQPLVAWAVLYRHLSIAELLIERGVPNCNIKNQEDWKNYVASGRAGRFDRGFWSDVSDEKVEERVRD
jgi:ankyrin repeat protein